MSSSSQGSQTSVVIPSRLRDRRMAPESKILRFGVVIAICSKCLRKSLDADTAGDFVDMGVEWGVGWCFAMLIGVLGSGSADACNKTFSFS